MIFRGLAPMIGHFKTVPLQILRSPTEIPALNATHGTAIKGWGLGGTNLVDAKMCQDMPRCAKEIA